MPSLLQQRISILSDVWYKLDRLIVLYSVLALCGLAQISFAQDSTVAFNRFQHEVVSFRLPNTTDSVRTDIYLAVPYSFLFFQNAVDKYIADYIVTIEIKDSVVDSTIVFRKQENSIVLATAVMDKLKELDQTRADASQISIHLAAGRTYRIVIHVKDRTKADYATSDFLYRTRSFPLAAAGLSISDIILYRSKAGTRMTPNIGDDGSELSPEESGAFFEIYNAPQSTPLWVTSVLTDQSGEEISRTTSVYVPGGRAKEPVFAPIIDDDLWTGSYNLHTFVTENASDTSLDVKKLQTRAFAQSNHPLKVAFGRGVPLATNDLDESIQQLALISYGNAYDSLMSARTPAEKRLAIKQFWEKTNHYHNQITTRPMDVFYRRVRYANTHFSQMGPGWRTDRGKIYIICGEPSAIDRSTYSIGQKPYEIWSYYDINQRYYFVDQFLINDYRLMNQMIPVGTFYWDREGQ
ncbi:MAG TPA: GWxTD domain-containing protein [Candidatus Kapabacteria bacterium]|nr:GWxTD domain-containing protein [Candidatus Kapabacteria bacterium]